MNDRYQLVALGNEQLLTDLKGLVRREQCALADMLAHLAELDERRLFLDLGYSSLFAYCTEALGFCKSTAGRRIAAARVCRRYPEAFLRVANGELRLSVLSILGAQLNAVNAAELFDACSGKSFEQVEELLAARFPRADVRDSIRRLPDVGRRAPDVGSETAAPMSKHATSEERTSPTAAVSAANASVPTDKPLQTPPATPARARIEPLSPDRFGVHFTADAEFRELLEEVKALASHQQTRGELLPIMKCALEAYRRELRKKRFAIVAKPQPAGPRAAVASVNVSSAPLHVKRTRRVSALVRRSVHARDEGRCTFVADDGRRCGTRNFLELDHVQPWARGGESTVDNLRLRCRPHNQHSAYTQFGSAHIRAAVERARNQNRKKRDVGRGAEGVDASTHDYDRRESAPKPLHDAEG